MEMVHSFRTSFVSLVLSYKQVRERSGGGISKGGKRKTKRDQDIERDEKKPITSGNICFYYWWL